MTVNTTQNLDSEHRENLLEEYKLISTRADNFSNLIWQLAILLLTINAGGIAILGQFQKPGFEQYTLIVLLAGASIFILRWWNRAANRWNSRINVWYERIKEIENDLALWANRDIQVLDNDKKGIVQVSQEDEARLVLLKKKISLKHYPIASIRGFRNELVRFATIIWVLAVVREAIITIAICFDTQNLYVFAGQPQQPITAIIVVIAVPLVVFSGRGLIGFLRDSQTQ